VIDLKAYTARGFPGQWDEALAHVPVAGIDRRQSQSIVRLCPETEAILYGPDFSPTKLCYRTGARPTLERIAADLAGRTPRRRAVSAMKWVADHVIHPYLTGPLAPDRAFTEEQLIDSGRGWCNEQARVFIALCEVMEIPARWCSLFHANGRCGHAAAEAHVDHRWAFFDATFAVWVALPDGRAAEARELSGAFRKLAHRAYRPTLADFYRRALAFADDSPAWGKAARPHVDRGGDLLDVVGICNYVIDGVSVVGP